MVQDNRQKKPATTGKPGVYTISPSLPFLRTLADQLICGDLIDGFSPQSDPLSLSECTIYLPTRRAARALGLELLDCMKEHTGSEAVILPRIRTLGDLDEEEQLDDIAGFASEVSGILAHMGNVIDPVERHLTLARLTKSWINSMQPDTRELFEKEHIVVPSSAADSLRLARDLADFMDQVETEEADWTDIERIADKDHAQWWEVTLRFLDILMTAWPNYLSSCDKTNPAAFRRLIADHRIEKLQTNPPKGPVIAAGSTGSIPATSRLLTCIAGMKNGAVILPGLDRNLPPGIAGRFVTDDELTHEAAASTHPQYSMVRLLSMMKCNLDDVVEIGTEPPLKALQGDILNICLRPAEDTGNWLEIRNRYSDSALRDAFSSVQLIEAPGERVEALTIALILREALETEGKTAALVTPDRQLARRVASELQRFAIEIDDSAGHSLINSQAASELRFLLEVVFGEGDPVSWSGFFKSRLAAELANGNREYPASPILDERFAQLLELAIIRDCLQLPTPNQLVDAVEMARQRVEKTSYAPGALKNLSPAEWQAMAEIASRLSDAMVPLVALNKASRRLTTTDLAETLLFMGGANGVNFFSLEGGEELLSLLESHCGLGSSYEDRGFNFAPGEVTSVFDTLLAPLSVRSSMRTHPRLQIFGTLEARLQEIDRVVLGGLNENVWPPSSRNDPFLNRPMRSSLGLPLPERRVGLAAHDFVQLSGKSEVFYTRAKRQGDAPSITSRWLQRMETFLGKELWDEIRKRGDQYLHHAGMIDFTDGQLPELERTRAKPPVEARPKRLSITEIETWIRDPYAIYAKHVLGLRPLPDLVRSADPALRGTLYHDIFADFIETWQGMITPASRDTLDRIADRHFESAKIPPEINAFWRPRFDGVAESFLDWESKRRGMIASSHCEIDGMAEIGDTGFTLHGRADRIDVTLDGELIVLDYKTGGHPTKAQARTLSPQLALEGALARRGAFENVQSGDLAALNYVRLREGNSFKADDITVDGRNPVGTANEIAEQAYDKLVDLISSYQNPEQGYVSRYAPVSEKDITGDYDHLARVREWSIAEEGEGGDNNGGEDN